MSETPAVFRNVRYERRIALLEENLRRLASGLDQLYNAHMALRDAVYCLGDPLRGLPALPTVPGRDFGKAS